MWASNSIPLAYIADVPQQVEPDETRDGRGRQTKTLSGGEKSFSTICLLLSLWEAMGSPIRCLDELWADTAPVFVPMTNGSSDVFMDNVNRDVSMRMMVRTPQDGARMST